MWVSRIVLMGILVITIGVPRAGAVNTNVRRTLREAPGRVGLTLPPQYGVATDEIAESAARALPIPASGGAFTYRYDPSTRSYERTTETLGPMMFMERPQTLGQRVWNVGLSGQYLELDEFDGERVGRDPFPVITAATGPVRFSATPKIVYHLGTFNLTYGVLDDLDVNLAIPFAALDFDTNATRQAVTGGAPLIVTEHASVPLALADAYLRAKYHLGEFGGMHTAAGFVVRLPTGEENMALGADAELGPYVYLSTLLWDRLEPSFNAGFNFNVADMQQSSVQYALGATVQALEPLSFAVSFLGRSEVAKDVQDRSISGPHLTPSGPASTPYAGLDPGPKNFIDVAAGAHIRLYKTLVVTAGIYKALNDDGLRSSEFSPVGSLQATF